MAPFSQSWTHGAICVTLILLGLLLLLLLLLLPLVNLRVRLRLRILDFTSLASTGQNDEGTEARLNPSLCFSTWDFLLLLLLQLLLATVGPVTNTKDSGTLTRPLLKASSSSFSLDFLRPGYSDEWAPVPSSDSVSQGNAWSMALGLRQSRS
eukprot:TRINITY_DN3715_c0_g1_i1.p1 TRINITY_DN3715_c0_g1~~TRINITY_DN3715_c0_g1_i1.p1  ORF type:complete len:152 (-),score=8.08 TRINITY_DN3715_c0_g1_i1:286-741(-)